MNRIHNFLYNFELRKSKVTYWTTKLTLSENILNDVTSSDIRDKHFLTDIAIFYVMLNIIQELPKTLIFSNFILRDKSDYSDLN